MDNKVYKCDNCSNVTKQKEDKVFCKVFNAWVDLKKKCSKYKVSGYVSFGCGYSAEIG